ncbi:MAG: carbohydrate-binding protein [Cellvibrionaceae bacterium]|nr:carbohydrate-binding protein [Cellvibrionaceae bacterium]
MPLILTACSGDNAISNAPDPSPPLNFRQETGETIGGLVAFYDFERSFADVTGKVATAQPIGINTSDTSTGSVYIDEFDGIHSLSAAAEFSGISGLRLPNIIYSPSYTVSLWVKPETEDVGAIFYAQSSQGSLLLDGRGLTVTGNTGQGADNNLPITYTSKDYVLTEGEYSHIAFSVSYGAVNLYLNGAPIYAPGDYNGLDVFGGADTEDTSDDWLVDDDSFGDLFSGQDTTVALGVSADTGADAGELKPFRGKIDNLRVYDESVYYVNLILLANEVLNEGPAATITPLLSGADIELSWELERIEATSISLSRQSFEEPEQVLDLTGDMPLAGSDTRYTDSAVPAGRNYRYTLSAVTEMQQVFSPLSDYIRVPGREAYSAISAALNEQSENIELSVYLENIDLASYDILRNTEALVASAEEIATELTELSYIDAVDDDSPHAPGTPYFYWARVTDEDGVVTTSLALPAARATAAGEFVPPNILTLEENQDGFCSVDGAVENNNAGFTGEGFANTDNAPGTSIRWKIAVETPGEYSLRFRFANGGSGDRPGDLTLNGEPIAMVSLPETGAWTNYENSVRLTLNLEAIEYDIQLTGNGDSGLSNIDHLELAPNDSGAQSPSGIACQ